VPNASVVVTNLDTNATVRAKSNETGYYEAALLLPGPYTVTIEAPGFKKIVRSGITLQITDRRDVSVTLEVGAVTESVTVTAEAPLVDVSRTDSGRVIDNRSVRDLPVMANTVFTMIRYTAGVQSGGPSILLGPHSTQGGSDYNTGTGIGGNTWTIDGAINDGNARYTANLPSVDAVAEVKVLTTTFEGSFGHSTGLGIAVMTKTGTNQYHGGASNTYWSQRWQGSSFFAKQNYYKYIASLRAAGDIAGADAAARWSTTTGRNLSREPRRTSAVAVTSSRSSLRRKFRCWTISRRTTGIIAACSGRGRSFRPAARATTSG
jgi:hypothetical protein